MTEIYLHIVARISSLNKMKNPGMTHKSVAASLTEFLRHYPAKVRLFAVCLCAIGGTEPCCCAPYSHR